ncbi:adenylate cyclase [Thalassobaculum fulvum]|uniref:Adenylate cyclase n=1 Tax=Thalassobaculum fulvum TaxID=1633335 RepID=A0A918XNK5_9PROT|nr:adenylate/guanylate cyclase domain-containing protein [Thalassobaculum fulvum]GHD39570.1 adenylate cyclase [Thalassobaculum fulvum]
MSRPPAVPEVSTPAKAGDGRGGEGVLPARVRAALREQQGSSEILIGWIQLAVVTAFGTLYAISPKAFPPEVEFRPIPWFLGCYLAFTLARLALAHARRLPRWFLALSVLADMVLLLGMIWSFHLQYMQPAAFYLKAPTLLYVFIFIALRTLRFEPVFVLLAGGAAAVGWLLMAGYALMWDPHAAPVTRDYVLYLTSNSVLIGAEFDKVVSILTVTGILALAIVRARRLLVRAVRESLAARELSRFFSRDVADRITDLDAGVEIGRGELRDAAVLNVDMRGFSRLATEIAPDDLIALLAEYQRLVVPLVQSHGGSIDKFLGDGVMATFGATRPSDTAAADALRAVDELVAATAAWTDGRLAAGLPAPPGGLAVAAGPVVFGAVGDESRLEYTVIGTPVNLSAKLEKHTKAEAVRALTDAETYEAGLRQGYRPGRPAERRPGRAVAGLDVPLDLVVLAG